MDALTRGYAPGCDVSPLRGDRPAHKPFHTRAERTPHFVQVASAATSKQAFTHISRRTCQSHSRTSFYPLVRKWLFDVLIGFGAQNPALRGKPGS